MHPYEELVYKRIVQAIESIDIVAEPDVYALWLEYSSGASADSKGNEISIQASIWLSYNTKSHRDAEISAGMAADEATWSFGSWAHVGMPIFPVHFDYGSDPPSQDFNLRDEWCAARAIVRNGVDEGGRPEYPEIVLYDATRKSLARIVKLIHSRGVLTAKFNQDIPVVIGYHECGDTQDAALTKEANPPGLATKAEEWVLGRTYEQIEEIEKAERRISENPDELVAHKTMELLKDFELDRDSAQRREAARLKLSVYDIRERLSKLGPAAVTPILDMIEEYVYLPQFYDPPTRLKTPEELKADARANMERIREEMELKNTDPEAFASLPKIKRGWTPNHNLTCHGLSAIQSINSAAETEIERLVLMMTELYKTSASQVWTGLNLVEVARTLHVLHPERYPHAELGPRDNKLLNFQKFGLT